MLRLIACVNEDGCIDGFAPPKTDLQRFQALTLGCAVIMGRKTYDTLPTALKHRDVIVVTRSLETMVRISEAGIANPSTGAIAAPNLGCAIHIGAAGASETWIAGGGEIYAQAIDGCHMLYVSHVNGTGGSVKFPNVSSAAFERIALQHHPDHDLCIYKRISAA